MVQVGPPSKVVDHQCITRYIQQIKDPRTRLVLPQRLSPKNYSQRPTDKRSIQRKHTLYRDNSKLHYYVPYTTTHGFICQGQRKQIPRWTSGRVIQTQSIKRETFLVIELCLHSEHNRISFIYYIFEEYKGLSLEIASPYEGRLPTMQGHKHILPMPLPQKVISLLQSRKDS